MGLGSQPRVSYTYGFDADRPSNTVVPVGTLFYSGTDGSLYIANSGAWAIVGNGGAAIGFFSNGITIPTTKQVSGIAELNLNAATGNPVNVQVNSVNKLTVTSTLITALVALRATTDLQAVSTTTTGASPQTANTPAGRAQIAAGAATVTVNNSLVTANSHVFAVVSSVDGTLTSLKSVVPGAGSFVITGNANATGVTNVDWFVLNP